MSDGLLSTREAANLLGVGTTSVKRWADAGLLEHVRTPGGHRRYPRRAVLDLVSPRPEGGAQPSQEQVSVWVQRLVGGIDPEEVFEALVEERRRRRSWWRVADAMGAVLDEIGRGWASGEISVLREHLASERLARGLARVIEDIDVPPEAPRCLLMTAPGDDHTLGLAVLEVCLRERGWASRWTGRRTPVDEVVRLVGERQVDMLAVSASEYSTDQVALSAVARQLGKACERTNTDLLLGGAGRWPDPPPFGTRLRTFSELREYSPLERRQ